MNQDIWTKFADYPDNVKAQLKRIENTIMVVAANLNAGKVKASLKWGEASYLVEGGSAIRIDWKSKQPDVVKVLFHCQTSLVSTFREVYPKAFEYEGNRALLIPLTVNIANTPIAECISLALTYQNIKHLPLLGAWPTDNASI